MGLLPQPCLGARWVGGLALGSRLPDLLMLPVPKPPLHAEGARGEPAGPVALGLGFSWVNGFERGPLSFLFLSFSDFLLFTLLFLSSPHPWALPPPPGADEVPAQHVRSTGPRDSMCQSSARARPPLMCHLDPCPSLPQGERAGDATRIHEGLRR